MPEDRPAPDVRLASMHRAKDLEFESVLTAGVKKRIVPHHAVLAGADDKVTKEQTLKRERSLLYVSATQAKREVIVRCHDEPSPGLPRESKEWNGSVLSLDDGIIDIPAGF